MLGLSNVFVELLIRTFAPIKIDDVFVQFFHILIFFLYPSYLIFGSWKKSLLLGFFLFVIIIPIYFLIAEETISFYFAAFFILSWVVFLSFFKENKKQVAEIFLGNSNWRKSSLSGLLAGLLLGAHLFSVIWLSKTFLPTSINFPKDFINFFLEANFSLLGMEFLFRYLLFLRLIERNYFPFWLASILSTLLFILPFLTNPSFNQNIAVVIGLIYYGLMQGFSSCWLVYKTKSLLPSIIFSFVLTIFLSLIF